MLYNSSQIDIENTLYVCVLFIWYKWFFCRSQISQFSSKLVEFFLAVLNFHDPAFEPKSNFSGLSVILDIYIIWIGWPTIQNRKCFEIIEYRNFLCTIHRILSRFFILHGGCVHYKRKQCGSLFFQTDHMSAIFYVYYCQIFSYFFTCLGKIIKCI